MTFGAALGEMATREHFRPLFLHGVVRIRFAPGKALANVSGMKMVRAQLGDFHGRRKYLNSHYLRQESGALAIQILNNITI